MAIAAGSMQLPDAKEFDLEVMTGPSRGSMKTFFVISNPICSVSTGKRWLGRETGLLLLVSLVTLGWMAETSLADSDAADDLLDYEIRPLRAGQERFGEKLPFDGSGQSLYELMGMNDGHWYEVKISYPASTPAIFSIDLFSHFPGDSTLRGRRLLNTEKIIFQNENTDIQDPSDMIRRVRVSVKPEGFVSNPSRREQPFVIYNIVLERVILGIPMQALWVGFLVLLVVCFSVLASIPIVHRLLPRKNSQKQSL